MTPAAPTAPACPECETDLHPSGKGRYWSCRYCGATLPVTD